MADQDWKGDEKYKPVRVLGRGGGGTVWLVIETLMQGDNPVQRYVAVKRLNPDLEPDGSPEDRSNRVRREVLALQTAASRSMPALYGVITVEGEPAIVMEWVQGVTLTDWVAARPTILEALEVGAMLFEAVADLHAHRVSREGGDGASQPLVHRDIKPSNCMIARPGGNVAVREVRLLDFGLGFTHEDPADRLSGTNGWSAPEQFDQDLPDVGPAADVFAAAAVLFFACSGVPPFDTMASECATLTEEPRWTALPPLPALRALLFKCFDHDPTARPSAAEVARLLRAMHASLLSPHNLSDPGRVRALLLRSTDIERLTEALRGRTGQLVNLVGPGGVGKTTLAQHVALRMLDQFPAGVALVDVALSEFETEFVGPLIKQASDVSGALGRCRTTPGVARGLIVVDNFEQRLGQLEALLALARQSPGWAVLVLSRVLLHASALPAIELLPLSTEIPKDAAPSGCHSPALELFLIRLGPVRARIEFDAAALASATAVVACLGGLPLAIEMASATVAASGDPQARLNNLGDVLSLSSAGLPGMASHHRERSLEAVMEWSHDLLDENSRRVLRRVSVFENGFRLLDADAVCNWEGDIEWPPGEPAPAALDGSLDARPVVGSLRVLARHGWISDWRTSLSGVITMPPLAALFASDRLSLAEERIDTEAAHMRWYLRLAQEGWGLRTDQRRASDCIHANTKKAAILVDSRVEGERVSPELHRILCEERPERWTIAVLGHNEWRRWVLRLIGTEHLFKAMADGVAEMERTL